MFNLIKLLFRKVESALINSKNDKIHIHNGMHYFAVENINVNEIVNILDIKKTERLICDNAFKYLWENENQKSDCFKIIISPKIENWNFIYCETGSFQFNKIIVEKLISISKNRVNYYYADSCVDGYDWILADKGVVFREFKYNMSEISKNIGNCLTIEENNFLNHINKNDEFIFGEDVYFSIVDATCQIKTKYFEENQKFIIGEISKL